MAECWAVNTADMQTLISAFVWLLLGAVALPQLLRIDWEWRVRRHLRCRRLARIRAAAAARASWERVQDSQRETFYDSFD